ncbi:hypothetical protein HUJ04_002720 [Dendroctonus ponderosae]|uniref:EGF-like domain-containing protein n=1 Tax=Dendroctonus ponderosae TaxID=77166 RepID=A0AAR5QJD4_DENPD|nr:hypothetical protein HUJ04_002720 [Dendroctonus ponderosae]
MGFMWRSILFGFVLLLYLISEGACSQVVEYSDETALKAAEAHKASTTTVSISTVTPSSTTRTRKLRKRTRRRKRIRLSSSSVAPTYSQSTASPVAPHEEKIKRRQRRLKKRRRGSSKVRNSANDSRSAIQTRNLFQPITPKESSPKISGTPSAFAPRKETTTRCSKNNGGCAHTCRPTGSRKCGCLKGFSLSGDGHNCLDINECLLDNGKCEMNCTNTVGSYRCKCPNGLRLNRDQKSCDDINECLLRNGHGPCQDTCINSHGAYKCSCDRLNGTKLGNDGQSCIDLDECAQGNGGCSHICINTFGRFFCSCPEGMELSSDSQTCQDINECETEHMKIKCPNGCMNTQGSFRCLNISDLQNDESYQYVVCPPLFPPENGYFKCSRKHALKTHTKSGRRQIKNSLGTKCFLVCPEGFKRQGQGFRLNCGYGGQWMGKMDAECIALEAPIQNRSA